MSACSLLRIAVALGLATALPFSAFTAETAASALAIRNQVTASATGAADRTIQSKDDIYITETIRTGEKSRAQLLFNDKSVLGLGPAAEVVISQYVYDSKKKAGQLEVDVKDGAFRILGGALSKGEGKVEVKTPVATCGIRGSMLIGQYSKAHHTLIVAPLAGTMSVQTHSGQQFTVKADPGASQIQGVVIVNMPEITKDGEKGGENAPPGGIGPMAAQKPLTDSETAQANSGGPQGDTRVIKSAEEAPPPGDLGAPVMTEQQRKAQADLLTTLSPSAQQEFITAIESVRTNTGTPSTEDPSSGQAIIFFHPDINRLLNTVRLQGVLVTESGMENIIAITRQAYQENPGNYTGSYESSMTTGFRDFIAKISVRDNPLYLTIESWPQVAASGGFSLDSLRGPFPFTRGTILEVYAPAITEFQWLQRHTGGFTDMNLDSVTRGDFDRIKPNWIHEF